jgi:hypothetical protein
LHNKFNRLKEWLLQPITPEGHSRPAARLDVLYGVHLLGAVEARTMRDRLSDNGYFVYPEPEKVCLHYLASLTCEEPGHKKFFHNAILQSAAHFLFSTIDGLGYKRNTHGKSMLAGIPSAVVVWICLLVRLNFPNRILMC